MEDHTGFSMLEPVENLSSDEILTVFGGSISNTKSLFNGDRASSLKYEAYLDYYRRQWNICVAHANGRYVAVKTRRDMEELVGDLSLCKTRRDIFAILRAKMAANVSDEACYYSIDLAARLLLMLKIGVFKHQALPRRCLAWTDGSLPEFVQGHFDEAPILNYDHVRLPKAFNAWSIATIGGIDIGFTDNLADHLLLVEDDTRVLIFHHASFLEWPTK
jgi:hypothetical protein